jgi:hypothetical protein
MTESVKVKNVRILTYGYRTCDFWLWLELFYAVDFLQGIGLAKLKQQQQQQQNSYILILFYILFYSTCYSFSAALLVFGTDALLFPLNNGNGKYI